MWLCMCQKEERCETVYVELTRADHGKKVENKAF